jgi:hypothetical protein
MPEAKEHCGTSGSHRAVRVVKNEGWQVLDIA